MPTKMQDIFDKNLSARLSGKIDAESGLKEDAAAEIQPLLELAAACRAALKVDVPEQSRLATRERVMTRARELRAGSRPLHRARNRGRYMLRPVALAAGLLALSTGSAFAANAAGPDSFLYPVKQKLEDARGVIAAQTLDRAAVAAGNAGKRLDEIQAMVGKGQPGYVADLLAGYDRQITDAQRLTDDAAAAGEDVSAVSGMIAATRARHATLMNDIKTGVPDDVRAVIEDEEAHFGGMSGGGSGDHENGPQQMATPDATAPAGGGENASHEEDTGNPQGGNMSPGGAEGSGQPPASGGESQSGMQQNEPLSPPAETPSGEQKMPGGESQNPVGGRQMNSTPHSSVR